MSKETKRAKFEAREAKKLKLVCRYCSKPVSKEEAKFKGKKEYHPDCIRRMRGAYRRAPKKALVGGLVNPR